MIIREESNFKTVLIDINRKQKEMLSTNWNQNQAKRKRAIHSIFHDNKVYKNIEAQNH